MAPRGTPIEDTDIKAFLESEADFAFEMRTLHALTQLGFDCQHGATYRDPITEKIRQFDIRALATQGQWQLWLSVECKNIGVENPLLVHTVPRTGAEAFHEVVRPPNHSVRRSWPETRRITGVESVYGPAEQVGKRTDQVSLKNDDTFVRLDSAVFEKVSQSINAARDLLTQAAAPKSVDMVAAIVPVLVVPDGMLWQVAYLPDGSIAQDPQRVDRTCLYVNHQWAITVAMMELKYALSHLEITTLHGLQDLVASLFGDRGLFALGSALFPQ